MPRSLPYAFCKADSRFLAEYRPSAKIEKKNCTTLEISGMPNDSRGWKACFAKSSNRVMHDSTGEPITHKSALMIPPTSVSVVDDSR
jgi:hypothetical protein